MSSSDEIRKSSQDKLDALQGWLRQLQGAVVAFSAGVDSTFVLAVARQCLGDRVLALTAHSPSVPLVERESARALARQLDARHVEVDSHEMDDPRYVANAADRCYYCKSELYRLCLEAGRREGLVTILDGFNVDDRKDDRPGHRAAEECGVRSPLADFGLGKAEVRAWSEAFGLPTWDKPQMACLASRVPTGTAITSERLARVEHAESALRAIGLRSVRVRHHEDIGRLEISAEEAELAFNRRSEVAQAIRTAGFKLAVLDLEPFRSGRMNELRDALRVIST